MAAGDVHHLRWKGLPVQLLVAALFSALGSPLIPAALAASPGDPAEASLRPAQPAPGRVQTPTSGLVTIESDLQRADNKTGVITATGNVRIIYPDERVIATARQAQYFSQEGRVILSGDVDIIQEGGNALRAERVIYDVNSERLLAQPPQGQQVFSKVRLPSSDSQPASSQPASTPAAASSAP